MQLGLVGRTGSGKSSLFQVLFRMVSSYQGVVLIDGVNLAAIPLDILRLVFLFGRNCYTEKEPTAEGLPGPPRGFGKQGNMVIYF